ncbi:NUDIX hydrolase [Rhodococcus sp. 15-1154-1]|nr:NUDIX domain-containing protein [Rhodococcus sp. 15-1154-1]OZF07699.1 NUDIX hydrolase [Rhodococcus sp. 15-1154-1]
MAKLSAGIILYRTVNGEVEVLLGHPGGPFWAKKDAGAWSIIKGEYEDNEDPWAAAQREFLEETGSPVPAGTDPIQLTPVKQPSGKIVTAFGVEGDLDAAGAQSNTFEMEWPKGSGNFKSFPEIDKHEWFTSDDAEAKLLKGHRPILTELLGHLPS